MSLPLTRLRTRARSRGLSMIELIMFIVVVGIALAALLKVFAQATKASADPLVRRQALAIAESLMQEVQLMSFSWCDLNDTNAETANSAAECASLPEAMGPEAGETRYGPAQFDNVNDYNGFAMTGIKDITNNPVPGLESYSASIATANVALGSIAAADALRITITVTGPGATSISLEGWRTRYAPKS